MLTYLSNYTQSFHYLSVYPSIGLSVSIWPVSSAYLSIDNAKLPLTVPSTSLFWKCSSSLRNLISSVTLKLGSLWTIPIWKCNWYHMPCVLKSAQPTFRVHVHPSTLQCDPLSLACQSLCILIRPYMRLILVANSSNNYQAMHSRSIAKKSYIMWPFENWYFEYYFHIWLYDATDIFPATVDKEPISTPILWIYYIMT